MSATPHYARSAASGVIVAMSAFSLIGVAVGGLGIGHTVRQMYAAPRSSRSSYMAVFFMANGLVGAISSVRRIQDSSSPGLSSRCAEAGRLVSCASQKKNGQHRPYAPFCGGRPHRGTMYTVALHSSYFFLFISSSNRANILPYPLIMFFCSSWFRHSAIRLIVRHRFGIRTLHAVLQAFLPAETQDRPPPRLPKFSHDTLTHECCPMRCISASSSAEATRHPPKRAITRFAAPTSDRSLLPPFGIRPPWVRGGKLLKNPWRKLHYFTQ